ncbi:hypothetical protein ACF07V_13080 [Streptomyces sp. NPDC015661]|uniref:hypothetical protein n=1 Tax=Streptomyces sp. NPDC015661 TaxID=3364961 RepID=UPI0036FD7541
MGKVEDGKPYRWGRLHAAVQVLEGLAEGRTGLGLPSERKKTTSTPRNNFVILLRDMGLQLLAAREKGGDHARAAAAVVGDITELIAPEPMYGKGLNPKEIAAFHEGYEHQMGLYREKWEKLVL